MQTQDCKKPADIPPLDLPSNVVPPKSLPSLAAMPVAYSVYLRRLYQGVYGALGVAVIIALAPYLLAPAIPGWHKLLWGGALCLLLMGLGFLYRQQCARIPQGVLAYEQGKWLWWEKGMCREWTLIGAVLCWPGLIILPFKDRAQDHKIYLLLCQDALSPADQARLRTWLRACLKPKA